MDNATNLGLDPNKQGSGLLNIKKIVDAIKPELPEDKYDDSHIGTDVRPLLSDEMFLILLLVILILML